MQSILRHTSSWYVSDLQSLHKNLFVRCKLTWLDIIPNRCFASGPHHLHRIWHFNGHAWLCVLQAMLTNWYPKTLLCNYALLSKACYLSSCPAAAAPKCAWELCLHYITLVCLALIYCSKLPSRDHLAVRSDRAAFRSKPKLATGNCFTFYPVRQWLKFLYIYSHW